VNFGTPTHVLLGLIDLLVEGWLTEPFAKHEGSKEQGDENEEEDNRN